MISLECVGFFYEIQVRSSWDFLEIQEEGGESK
jgi:hypothetical protein